MRFSFNALPLLFCELFFLFFFSYKKKIIGETESTLILIRHGESLWNEKNLFTGCCDVPLTKRGVEEAIVAGKRISYIPVDIIFTSALIRAQMTAMLAMTQHRQKKVLNQNCYIGSQVVNLLVKFKTLTDKADLFFFLFTHAIGMINSAFRKRNLPI